ncbi:LysR family transcriptional regulator [Roseovarius sp. SCSIO 43702]|uniref:LysR family transcriptional regulator n=1 Tax=Roseovarius sp. SCSIO 43702 TaxID=2823043 RepID=UPI001C735112|nr:LysR family transcriptional regulator [Roseovarius sp. SCSIO 43702]QYX56229.1 LysR family transcriptional regulator [Roseovarius sp. SCSIO 43702]
MQSPLPPLRALQAFESFGRLGSVTAAARELGVTAGAISQQIKILEAQLKIPLIMKDGRRASLAPGARSYHELLSSGFEKLRQAQGLLTERMADREVEISGLPTLLLKWLNPRLHRFDAPDRAVSFRLEATHVEPEVQFLNRMFRLTYGAASEAHPHRRALFHDVCFPVCSPDFLARHPEAAEPETMNALPWIDIDWGPAYANIPRLGDWLTAQGAPGPRVKPLSVHSLSGSALEAAAGGQGITLAQQSFASVDLRLGRLVRLSEASIPMPDPYHICWAPMLLENEVARSFLNWILSEARAD